MRSLPLLSAAAALAIGLLSAGPAAANPAYPSPTTASASPTATPSAAPGLQIPDFKTNAWIAVDAASGDILAGQNIDEQRPMASTLKVLTALTLLPRLQFDGSFEPTTHAANTEGAHVGVLAGNSYTIEQLMLGMLIKSGNDAAVALADAYGYERTLEAMNAEAKRVGAIRTTAKSPNGLDQPGQVSTAADLAQLYRAASLDPRFGTMLRTKVADFPGRPPIQPTQGRGTYPIYNHDTLLVSDYPGFQGGKSGFTSQAGRTYVGAAQRDGRTVIVALLGIGGGTTATARQILDWTFDSIDSMQPIGRLPDLPEPENIVPEPPQSATTVASASNSTEEALGTGKSEVETGTMAAAQPAELGASEPAQPSFLSTVLHLILTTLMWLVGLVAVAVVLLRARVLYRRRQRRLAAERAATRRAARSRTASSTSRRTPTRTG